MTRGRVVVSANMTAPAEAVWAVLTDWDQQHTWVPLTRTVGTGAARGRAVGEGLEAWTGVGPVGFLDVMVITEWDPPRRCAVRKVGRLITGNAQFEVAPRLVSGGAEGSRLTYTADIDLPLGRLGRAAWPAVRVGFVRGFQQSFHALDAQALNRPR